MCNLTQPGDSTMTLNLTNHYYTSDYNKHPNQYYIVCKSRVQYGMADIYYPGACLRDHETNPAELLRFRTQQDAYQYLIPRTTGHASSWIVTDRPDAYRRHYYAVDSHYITDRHDLGGYHHT